LQFDDMHLTTAIALAAPAVRTVYVRAWLCSDGKPAREVLKVVAVRSACRSHYGRRAAPDAVNGAEHAAGSHKELVEAGWIYEYESIYNDILVFDPQGGVVALGDSSFERDDARDEVVTCHGPPAEGGERLAPTIAALVDAVVARKRRTA
jgi:hypothetical protein